jgi:hypothetical protein
MSLLWKQAPATVNVAYGRRFATRGSSLSSAVCGLLAQGILRGLGCIASQGDAATASILKSGYLLFGMQPKIFTAGVARMKLLRIGEVQFNLLMRNRLVAACTDRVDCEIGVMSSCERDESRHRSPLDRLPTLKHNFGGKA